MAHRNGGVLKDLSLREIAARLVITQVPSARSAW
jgi:hypothetical protein